MDSGARLLESACGFCVGYGQSPQSGAVSVQTGNRNFKGRSGTKDAKVYLVSPEVAVATALTGVLTDPRDLGVAYPDIAIPDKFDINDDMVIKPASNNRNVFRGPNIGETPRNLPLPNQLGVGVATKVGDKITTDHIIPAGFVGKYRSNIAKSSEFVFRDVDSQFVQRCRDNAGKGIGTAIIAGYSYGQGSSREHAALCPMYLGVRLVIAKTIERIHMTNLVNFGIAPLIFNDERDYDKLEVEDELRIVDIGQMRKQSIIHVKNVTRDYEFAVAHELTPRQVEIVLCGRLINYGDEGKRTVNS